MTNLDEIDFYDYGFYLRSRDLQTFRILESFKCESFIGRCILKWNSDDKIKDICLYGLYNAGCVVCFKV